MIVKVILLVLSLVPQFRIRFSICVLDAILIRRGSHGEIAMLQPVGHIVDHLHQCLECTHLSFDGVFGVLAFDLTDNPCGSWHVLEIGRIERLCFNGDGIQE